MANNSDSADPLRTDEKSYGEKYKEHLLQQYVMYVEAADRVSSQRSLSNSFFLTVSTILLSVDGLVLGRNIGIFNNFDFTVVIVLTAGAIVFSITWYLILLSYDRLNSAKFKIIHAVETVLPAALYTAEWSILGQGKAPKKYRPLSKLEAWVPFAFVIMYVAIGIVEGLLYLHSIGQI